jgi:stalled ribosome rescue protein Dom34
MYATVVFINQDEARIFKLKPGGVETEHLRAHGKSHPQESQGRNHHKKDSDAEHFYHEVAQTLCQDKSNRWLVVGPGLAKKHFQHHVESHHKSFSKHIVGVETMDKSTDGEILKFAHAFFKKWDQFNPA